MPKTYTSFAPSLSKGSLHKLCFNKLSTNGVGEVKHAR